MRTIELDVANQDSVNAAIAKIVADASRLDVIVHNAGHMVLGPTETFTPEQLVSVYDTNVISAQLVNRAALPYLRAQHDGLLIWVGSTSTRGGTPPYGPCFAAKARCPRSHIRRRSGALRNRHHHHRAWLVHHRNQPLPERRAPRRHESC